MFAAPLGSVSACHPCVCSSRLTFVRTSDNKNLYGECMESNPMAELEDIQDWLMQCPTHWPTLLRIRRENSRYERGHAAVALGARMCHLVLTHTKHDSGVAWRAACALRGGRAAHMHRVGLRRGARRVECIAECVADVSSCEKGGQGRRSSDETALAGQHRAGIGQNRSGEPAQRITLRLAIG